MGVKKPDDFPVGNVTWIGVTAFCQWLSQKEGETCYLPSEAQWEYACRAGMTTAWCSGDDEATLKEYAWYNANSGRETHPVGRLRPNAWGLYDMHGNVNEWCHDWLVEDYYKASPLEDPQGADTGEQRVFQGGSWSSGAGDCRSALRGRGKLGFRLDGLGFRIARMVSLQVQTEAE